MSDRAFSPEGALDSGPGGSRPGISAAKWRRESPGAFPDWRERSAGGRARLSRRRAGRLVRRGSTRSNAQAREFASPGASRRSAGGVRHMSLCGETRPASGLAGETPERRRRICGLARSPYRRRLSNPAEGRQVPRRVRVDRPPQRLRAGWFQGSSAPFACAARHAADNGAGGLISHAAMRPATAKPTIWAVM